MRGRPVVVALALGALPGAAQAAALRISEVLYDAAGTDGGKLFVELHGSPGLGLDGWSLEGVNGADGSVGPVLSLLGSVPADGFFVVADADAGVTEVAEADLLLDFDLQNGPDSLVLRDPQGAIADALGYGVFAAGEVFAGEGNPAIDPPAGQSLARLLADVDTDDNLSDFTALGVPTPGTGPLSVAEPGALLLLACGLSGTALLRRGLV
jgi:hypothetical protein